MRKSFAEYAEAAKRDPFAFPMPEGDPVMIAQPTLNSERAAFTAANEAAAAATCRRTSAAGRYASRCDAPPRGYCRS